MLTAMAVEAEWAVVATAAALAAVAALAGAAAGLVAVRQREGADDGGGMPAAAVMRVAAVRQPMVPQQRIGSEWERLQ